MSSISEKFVEVFHHQPDIIAAAPGRVNLIGEHIDYSQGFVLPFAIEARTFTAMRRNNEETIRISSLQRGKEIFTANLNEIRPGLAGRWERYALSAMWALGLSEGVDLLIDGRVPIGAGLSSSAALECSVATALNALFSFNLDLPTLARLTQKGENEYVGVPCGVMDQSVSLMAEAGCALLLDCRDLTTKMVPFDIAPHGLELLIIDTQAHHSLSNSGYSGRRSSCESAAKKIGVSSLRDVTIEELISHRRNLSADEYQRGRHTVTEMQRVLEAVEALSANDFIKLGELLSASHISLRDDFTVSCPELDSAVDTALACGALGARMIGGGFGGSAIALLEKERVEETKAAIKSAYLARSFKAPRFFTSLPSRGAQIIRLG